MNQHANQPPAPAEGHNLPARHLQIAASLQALHPINRRMPKLGRRLVLANVRACDMRGGRSIDRDDFAAAAEADQTLHRFRTEVEALDRPDRCLLLQTLLDVHLQMAHEWMGDVGDAKNLLRAAAVRPDARAGTPAPGRLPEVVASELVLARQAFGINPHDGTASRAVERVLRNMFAVLDPAPQTQIVMAVARSAAQVLNARAQRAPGTFAYLEEPQDA